MTRAALHLGDCLKIMPTLAADSIDAIVTDPPYGLVEPRSGASARNPRTEEQKEKRRGGFMGKKWDAEVPGPAFWAEALRVAKPGAHLLAFGGTRTFHRLAVAIEDAGWRIRDCLAWIYSSGFPKSLDVSKAIDREAGAARKKVGIAGRSGSKRNAMNGSFTGGEYAATEAAKAWEGWGTALKPAFEPIILARKPFPGRTVAGNVLEHGTGAINIDGCRIPLSAGEDLQRENGDAATWGTYGNGPNNSAKAQALGRWPANIIHDGSPEALAIFPRADSPEPRMTKRSPDKGGFGGFPNGQTQVEIGYGDSGSAARFFYCPKVDKGERDIGVKATGNHHPTVKPVDLLRYLCRLITPPGGIVLDPFMGSGSTGKAAMLEGFRFVGIELEAPYLEIARARIAESEAAGFQQRLF
jgi:DNA modification methylase